MRSRIPVMSEFYSFSVINQVIINGIRRAMKACNKINDRLPGSAKSFTVWILHSDRV